MKSLRTILLIACASLAFCATSASADIIFLLGNNPQPDEENVLFHGAGTFAGPGLTVTGLTQSSNFLVQFSSSELLVTPSSGQARVEAVDGGFMDLAINLLGGTFTDIIFALNPLEPGARGTSIVTVFSAGDSFEFAFGPGESFLTILAINDQTIDSVTISSNIDIADIRQVRISGAAHLVPEPGTLALLGAATLGLAIRRRRQPR